MSKLNVYSIYDAKAAAFNTPFFSPTHGMAERMFTDECNREDSSLHQHPEDYTLFHLGEFDPTNGTLSAESVGRPVMTAQEVVHGLPLEFDQENKVAKLGE